ncbi:hypothetical protein [Pelomonas aquatica]|jgi:MSHA biogenesis protein MshJ|uniref:MSHA biogenesis protein MshJ n=1 Tax=Pelomonas aquatica TaxID=431058 RepID=A0A9X4LIH0_9BURK|nr:hypothetical protein [Pelomonas aquatica]MCY4756920.1 hypothetical protein [Pelomonas aquatica]MDG0864691.1 hypothetical protein [Pelomonas aquatica]
MKAGMPIDMALLRRSLGPLQAGWERRARRIDALSLRERAILFLSIVAVLAAAFDTLVLAPLSARASLRNDVQARQSAELGQLREQFVAASRAVGADAATGLRQRLDAAQAERQRLDVELRKGSVSLHDAEALSAVLQRLLARQPGLALERLRLLDDAPATARPSPAALPGMSRQGVELQVQGGYRELQHYLQALEQELPGLRWGEIRLAAGAPGEAPRLVAQLFLLKVQP